MKNKIKTLLSLFLTFMKIGGFTFGGGHAMIPLIQRETVENKNVEGNEAVLTGGFEAASATEAGRIAQNETIARNEAVESIEAVAPGESTAESAQIGEKTSKGTRRQRKPSRFLFNGVKIKKTAR